jgi:hypothetical protein
LLVDHLSLVLGMPAGNFVEIEVFRIDRLLVARCSRFFSMSSGRRMPQKLGINPTTV